MYFKPDANPTLPPTESGESDVDLTDNINGQEPQAIKTIEDEIKEKKAADDAKIAAEKKKLKKQQIVQIKEWEDSNKIWNIGWIKLEYSKDKQGYIKELAKWKKDCIENKNCNRWTNNKGTQLVYRAAKVIYHRTKPNEILSKGADNFPVKSESVPNLLEKEEMEALDSQEKFIQEWSKKGYKDCIKTKNEEFYTKLKKFDEKNFNISMKKKTGGSHQGYQVIMYKCEDDTLFDNNKKLCDNWVNKNK